MKRVDLMCDLCTWPLSVWHSGIQVHCVGRLLSPAGWMDSCVAVGNWLASLADINAFYLTDGTQLSEFDHHLYDTSVR